MIVCKHCDRHLKENEVNYPDDDTEKLEPVCDNCLSDLLGGIRKIKIPLRWWAVVRPNNEVRVFKLDSEDDIVDAEESGLYRKVFREILANTEEDAQKIAEEMTVDLIKYLNWK